MSSFTSRKNYNDNKKIMFEGIINNHHVRPICNVKCGVLTTAKCGGGWVSIYNVLALLSTNISLAKVVRSVEELNGFVLGGFFGTSPRAIVSVLSEYGFLSRMKFPKSSYNDVIKVGAVGILMYKRFGSFSTNFVAFKRISEDRYNFFNPTTSEESIEVFLKKRRAFKSAGIITVRNKIDQTRKNINFDNPLIKTAMSNV